MHEEVLLPLDDGVGHAQDGVEALLDVLDEPACLLQPLLQRLVALALVRLDRAGIDIVNAQPRHHVGIELHAKARLPPRPTLVTSTSGNDDVALDVDEAPAGLGSSRVISPIAALTCASLSPHSCDSRFTSRRASNSIGWRADAQRRVAGRRRIACGLHRLQLQRQAFGQGAGADAHRLQVVQQAAAPS